MLHHHFILSAKQNLSKIAIIDKHLNKNLTFKKTLIASLILCEKFKRYDNDFIGIMIPTSAGCSLSILGALMAGKIPVMINYSTRATENAEYAKNKCGFDITITSKALLKKINCRQIPGMIFLEDIMDSISIFDKIKAGLKAAMPSSIILKQVYRGNDSDIAVILFTSGSEKEPKAVQLTHKNITSNVLNIFEHIGILPEDKFLSILPFFHVFGFNTNLFAPIMNGSTFVTYPNPLDYKIIPKIIKEEKITVLIATPSFLMGYHKQAGPDDFKSLRLLVIGADKTPNWLFDEFLNKHNIKILEGYGTTETSPVISVNNLNDWKPGSVGKPIGNLHVKIIDRESGEKLSNGEIGKILVKGDSVFSGYFNDLEETSFRLRDGWYDTGDMGMIDEDGFLWHKGRLRRFVKIGGEMVSLVKIESILENYLPGNIECCIVDIPDSKKGSKIVAVTSLPIDKSDIRKNISKYLSNIEIPKKYIVMEELPKMGSGKIDFRTITEKVKELFHKNIY